MKAHIGADTESGLIHTVELTIATVAGNAMLKKYLHGEETLSSLIPTITRTTTRSNTLQKRRLGHSSPDQATQRR